VEQLAEQAAVVALDHLRQAPVVRDAVVRGDRDGVGHEDRGVVHQRDLDHDQAGAAARTRLVVGEHGLADAAGVRHGGLVSGRDDAVLERDLTDLKRREKLRKSRCGHDAPPCPASSRAGFSPLKARS
jgi:hypothetical protein